MPTFDIDIDIDEIVDALTKREVQRLVEYLKDHEYVDDYSKYVLENGNKTNLSDDMWFEVCKKLQQNRLSLTIEEIEFCEKISSRFI